MVPVITGRQRTMKPRLLYWEQYQFDRKTNDLPKEHNDVRRPLGDWKAVRSKPAGALELYNLKPIWAKERRSHGSSESRH